MITIWTREKPTQEGWYWFKGDNSRFNKFFKDGTIVYFHPEGHISMVGTNDAYRLDDLSGKWVGPLVVP